MGTARTRKADGTASKHGIQTGAGVIDADYRGPVMVLLFNHSEVDFEGMSPYPVAMITPACCCTSPETETQPGSMSLCGR